MFHYDPFVGQKVLRTFAEGGRLATHDAPDCIPDGWEHPEDEVRWVPRDASYEYNVIVNSNANFAPGVAVMVVADVDRGCWVIRRRSASGCDAGHAGRACRANRGNVGDTDSPRFPCGSRCGIA